MSLKFCPGTRLVSYQIHFHVQRIRIFEIQLLNFCQSYDQAHDSKQVDHCVGNFGQVFSHILKKQHCCELTVTHDVMVRYSGHALNKELRECYLGQRWHD